MNIIAIQETTRPSSQDVALWTAACIRISTTCISITRPHHTRVQIRLKFPLQPAYGDQMEVVQSRHSAGDPACEVMHLVKLRPLCPLVGQQVGLTRRLKTRQKGFHGLFQTSLYRKRGEIRTAVNRVFIMAFRDRIASRPPPFGVAFSPQIRTSRSANGVSKTSKLRHTITRYSIGVLRACRMRAYPHKVLVITAERPNYG